MQIVIVPFILKHLVLQNNFCFCSY